MAATVAVVVAVNLIFSNFRITRASTHWIVTEDGKIQSQMDSVFNMKRPYDLVAFMKQEERASMLDKLKQELLSRKVEIDSNEDRDTGLEEKFYKTDVDCLAAGKQLPDLDLYISTVLPLENKGIRPEEYLAPFEDGSFLMQPDCTEYIDLPYSPYAFEHLEGMKDRRKLPGTPELGLKNAITYQDNVDDYGHRVYQALRKNQTSWVLYNMAAFFWRIKGDPYNVIECVRRALHYSPRMQKDVALISLANVLHRAQKSNEAAIVVHAALDVSKELNVNHFTLGNIYAVLGEYNKSVICFENTLKIQPDFEAAAKRKHAVLCHAKLESALEAQHRSLQRTLNDLKDYQKKHDYWQQQSDKLLAEQVPLEVKLVQHMSYEELKIKQMSSEMGEYCRMGGRDGKQVLMCSWGKKADPAIELDLTVPNDVPLDTTIQEKEVSNVSSSDVPEVDYTRPVRGHKYTFETVKVPRGLTPEYLQEEWPSKDECDVHVQKVPDARNLTSTYLSPENKGYEVKPLLTEFLGLKEGDEHPLPWYPPVCVTLLDIPEGNTKSHDDINAISLDQRKTIPLGLKDHYHTDLLLGYVNNGAVTIEELGQRILSALKKPGGPKWILYNLAGLYWRIIGNNYHAIECLRRAIYTAPDDMVDVGEINLANILYRWGRYDDAKELVKVTLGLSKYEPEMNFLYGNLEWAKKNYTGAIYRYQQALEANPSYTEVINTLRALKCYLQYHQAAQSAAPVEEDYFYIDREAGEEKCVIETRTRTKNGPPHDTCGKCLSRCNRCNTCGQPAINSCQLPKGPGEPTVQEEMPKDEDNEEDHDVDLDTEGGTELCPEGGECSRVKVQQTPPHIKLEFINGQLFQKLIFAQSPNELTVRAEECVIFNDGTKSEGCSRPEFRAYIQQFDSIDSNPDAVTLFINGHLTKILPIQMRPDMLKDHVHIHIGRSPIGGEAKFVGGVKPEGGAKQGGTKQVGGANQVGGDKQVGGDELRQPGGPEKVPPFQGHIVINDLQDGEREADRDVQRHIHQLSDDSLPDTRKYIRKLLHLPIPKPEECRKMPKYDLRKFSSTWLSLNVKKVKIGEHINFKESISKSQYEEPVCNFDIPNQLQVDNLPGVQYRRELDYESESGLKEVLLKMGGKPETLDVVGTRIARALHKNITSWVVTNMAGLYWRVKGDARRAIECLRVATYTAPKLAQDVSLLSIANVLHRAGYINDAIVAASHAMDVSPGLVVGHFNMANLYAAKEQWDYAAMFYESTLGLQSSFEPAKQRLKIIQCMRTINIDLLG